MTEPTRRRFLTLSALGLGAAALTGCMGGPMIMQTSRADPVSAVTIAEAAEKLNAMRSERNLPLLGHNATLQKVAEEQAQLMADTTTIAHTAAPEQTLVVRLRRAGFGGGAGENLAGGPPNLDAVIAGWLKSPSHNRTMVNPDYVQFGLALRRGPSTTYNTYGTYWALLMGVKSPPGRA